MHAGMAAHVLSLVHPCMQDIFHDLGEFLARILCLPACPCLIPSPWTEAMNRPDGSSHDLGEFLDRIPYFVTYC